MSLTTAATDPTTVYGLFWWPPGTPLDVEYYDRTRWADGVPLPVGTTGDVALAWYIAGPEDGSIWSVTFTDPGGFQYVYEHAFTVSEYNPGTGYLKGCLSVKSWTTSDPFRWTLYYGCQHGYYSTSYMSWNILTGLHYPCKPITTWDVQMVGAASFSGMLNMVADGIGAVALAAPATLAPAIPSSSGGTSIVEPAIGPDTGQLAVTVFDTLCPTVTVPNTPVQLQFTYVAGSGGHTHTHSPPPSPSDIFQKVLKVTPYGSATFDASQGLLSGSTAFDGTMRAALLPGSATADFIVAASSPAGGTPSSGTIALDPSLGLVAVAAEPGSFFLSGGAGQQCGSQAWCDNHADNHYLSPAVLPHVQTFATLLSQLTDGKILVGLDDMSLVRGGIFDLDGNFQPSHFLHRQGHDVDISWVQVVRTGAFLSSHAYEDDIQQAAKSAGAKRVKEGPIHFRFPF